MQNHNKNKKYGGGEMRLRNRRAQSILEYVIVLAVVIGAILVFAGSQKSGGIKTLFDNVSTKISGAAGSIGENNP